MAKTMVTYPYTSNLRKGGWLFPDDSQTITSYLYTSNNYTGTGDALYTYAASALNQSALAANNQLDDIVWQNWNIIIQRSQDELERERRARADQAAAHRLAEERAERLLLAHLTPQQRDQYMEHRYFEVFTVRNRQLRRYRIAHGIAGNITVFNEAGRAVERLCIHTVGVPVADNLLAQKLMLEANEEHFLRTANHTQLAA